MAEKEIARTPETLDSQTLKVIPLPRARKIPLNSARNIRREHARLYRDMQRGKIPVDEGAKLSFVLMNQLKMIEMTILEQQLRELEKEDAPLLTLEK